MKHQFSEQLRRDHHLQQQLGVSSQRLRETGSRVKLHTSSKLGGGARRNKGSPSYKSHTHLPRISYKSQRPNKPKPV